MMRRHIYTVRDAMRAQVSHEAADYERAMDRQIAAIATDRRRAAFLMARPDIGMLQRGACLVFYTFASGDYCEAAEPEGLPLPALN